MNRNTYNDDKKCLIRGFGSYWNTKLLLNYHVSAKVYRNGLPNLLKKRNLIAFPPILSPEYGQPNETSVSLICWIIQSARRSWKKEKNKIKERNLVHSCYWHTVTDNMMFSIKVDGIEKSQESRSCIDVTALLSPVSHLARYCTQTDIFSILKRALCSYYCYFREANSLYF